MNPKQVKAVKRFAPYNIQVRSQLSTFSEKDQNAWKSWLQEYTKDSKHPDLHDDIPSSQIPPPESHIKPAKSQLFAIIDTCSLIRFRAQFMKFITDLRRSYQEQDCPVKFVMPLVVLEELDKCNRPVKRIKSNQKQPGEQHGAIKKEQDVQPLSGDQQSRELPIADLLQRDAPPRAFMRFIDVEMRAGLIVGDLDPYKTQQLPSLEILNHDDRILECSIRSKMFVEAHSPHPDTRVVLVTEDNNFKSKATVFGVASFRWREFEAKYHNFGRKHCVSTPLVRKLDTLSLKENSSEVFKQSLSEKDNEILSSESDKPNLFTSQKPQDDLKISSPHKPLVLERQGLSNSINSIGSKDRLRLVTSECSGAPSGPFKRSTSLKIKTKMFPYKTEDIEIVREVISLL